MSFDGTCGIKAEFYLEWAMQAKSEARELAVHEKSCKTATTFGLEPTHLQSIHLLPAAIPTAMRRAHALWWMLHAKRRANAA